MSSTIRDEDTPLPCGTEGSPRSGHFYYDVAKTRLYSLNTEARRLRRAGVPVLAEDAALAHLRTLESGTVRADDLPLSTGPASVNPRCSG